jgi:argininosuccinate synthase
VELIEPAAEIGMRHGVGIVDHIEDRIVGLKVRDIYEVPAAAILLTAHTELERLSARSTRTSSSRGSTRSGPTSSTRACGGSRCARTSRPTSSTSTSA